MVFLNLNHANCWCFHMSMQTKLWFLCFCSNAFISHTKHSVVRSMIRKRYKIVFEICVLVCHIASVLHISACNIFKCMRYQKEQKSIERSFMNVCLFSAKVIVFLVQITLFILLNINTQTYPVFTLPISHVQLNCLTKKTYFFISCV